MKNPRKKVSATAMPGSSPPLAPPGAPVPVQIRLQIEPKVNAPKYYANHAEINLTAFEMVITFARLPSRFDADEADRLSRGEIIVIPAEVQISVPIQMVPGLIEIMGRLKSDHDRTIGSTPYPRSEGAA